MHQPLTQFFLVTKTYLGLRVHVLQFFHNFYAYHNHLLEPQAKTQIVKFRLLLIETSSQVCHEYFFY